MKLITEPIRLSELTALANEQFGDFIKAVVDIELGTMVVGAELHSDEEAHLLERGSRQRNLWGINLYPSQHGRDGWLEFDSMINVRPGQGNRSRDVEDPEVRRQIEDLVARLVRADD